MFQRRLRLRHHQEVTDCEITMKDGSLSVVSPYDEEFVRLLKNAVPANERRWNPEGRSWLVAVRHGKTVQDICDKVFNQSPSLPEIVNVSSSPTQKVFEVRYIGTTKDRGDGESFAYGWLDEGWNVIFSESVLRAWFDAPSKPNEHATLYSVLNVKRTATDDEIKKGYWRMSKQWHPDVCNEPNAVEQYLVIQNAYKVLKDNRERYDAGLAFEASLSNNSSAKYESNSRNYNGYRSPYRCGLIKCNGVLSVGLFNVTEILSWDDIKDNQGRTLVVSWSKGADKFTEIWC